MTTRNEVEAFLKNEICTAMYMEPDEIEDDELFSDYGLESTTLVKILTNVCLHYKIELELKDILPHQSLSAATDFLHQKITERGPIPHNAVENTSEIGA